MRIYTTSYTTYAEPTYADPELRTALDVFRGTNNIWMAKTAPGKSMHESILERLPPAMRPEYDSVVEAHMDR